LITCLRKYFSLYIVIIISHCFIARSGAIEHANYTTKDGLSQNTVNCILEDSRGFIWFGTKDGLNRYDSHEFVIYDSSAEANLSLINTDVTCLVEDTSQSLIYIGTNGGGLSIFDLYTEEFLHYNTQNCNIPDDFIVDIKINDEGELYIATPKGLSVFDFENQRFEIIRAFIEGSKNEISLHNVRRLLCGKGGTIWLATHGQGIIKFNKNIQSAKLYAIDDLNSEGSVNIINDLAFTNIGDSLLVASEGGLYKMSIRNGIFDFIGFNDTCISSIAIQSDGNIWLASKAQGLIALTNRGKIKRYKNRIGESNSFPSDLLRNVFIDKKDNLWIGTKNDGIIQVILKNTPFEQMQDKNGNNLVEKPVYALSEDDTGNLCIGSVNGIDIWNPKSNTVEPYYIFKDKRVFSVWTILHEESLAWIGTSEGLVRLDK
jgi:ligand-binding sensor domain-containing protein